MYYKENTVVACTVFYLQSLIGSESHILRPLYLRPAQNFNSRDDTGSRVGIAFATEDTTIAVLNTLWRLNNVPPCYESLS